MTEPFDPPELDLKPEGMVIQIWVPNSEDGAQIANWIIKGLGFYEVPELARWGHLNGYRLDIAPYDVSEKEGYMEP